jgi:Amt family ammonium transporter
VTLTTPSPFGSGNIPEFVFMAYQMMFAIITPALITGAFANRVRFGAYLLFLVAWLTLVYFPFVHMVWGNGLLAKWGVLDFAGGIVVHNVAGMAALASVLYVGRRKVGDSIPHSIPLVALGTGLLWFGWYGFNAGSQLKVDAVTGLAFLNTDIAASFAGPVWMLLAWIFERKPKFVGLLTGAVAGLATITPCAGYVTPTSAAIIGIAAGVVCYFAVNLKNRLRWDDALDVWGVHGVGGALGVVLLGVMASTAVNSAGADGLLRGNAEFFWKQVLTVVGSSIYAFGFTFAMLFIINKVTRVSTTEGEEERGLDDALHGESAYEGV